MRRHSWFDARVVVTNAATFIGHGVPIRGTVLMPVGNAPTVHD